MADIPCHVVTSGGSVDLSSVIVNKSVSYSSSGITFSLDYTLTEDAWVYMMFSIGNGGVQVTADGKEIYSFANYVSTNALTNPCWVKLKKGTRVKSSGGTGLYQATFIFYKVSLT